MAVLPVGIGSAEEGGYQIERSLRFNSADSAYLSRTLTTPTNAKAWTFSTWIKRSKTGTAQSIFISTLGGAGVPQASSYFTSSDTIQIYDYTGSAYTFDLTTTQVFRDLSAWYHLVFVYDSANATSSSRVRLYVNGNQITSFSSASYPTQNADCAAFNRAYTHYLSQANAQYFDGYLAEVNFIDGSALDPTSFGEFNATTGVWQPKAYTGSYGTNGFYLPFNQEYETFLADYLVIAGGGGGGGGDGGGGGGAGGYRELSSQSLIKGTAYTVTVGAGAAGGSGYNNGSTGSNSVLASTTSNGGGYGGIGGNDISSTAGGNGGSGGGGGGRGGKSGGTATSGQGNNGGTSVTGNNAGSSRGAGGGGAGAVGGNATLDSGTPTNSTAGNGGNGTASSITGTSVTRGGGGGGGGYDSGSLAGTGGTGGGGNGGNGAAGSAGTVNTGGGGGGGGYNANNGGAGGSGVVIIKVPSTVTATFSGGVTSSLSTAVPGYKIYTVTATSTTSETVTFS